MNSKTRVLSAFHREKADRVPIDYAANEVIHQKIAQYTRSSSYDDVLEALQVDFRGIWAPYKGKDLFPHIPDTNVDPVYGYYTRWVANESGGYWDFCNFPLEHASDETIAHYPLPSADDFDYSHILSLVQKYKNYAIYTGNPGIADIINGTGRVMGMENTLVNLLTEDEATMTYIQRVVSMQLGIIERILQAAKGAIDFFWMGEDLGTQLGPMISVDLYKKILRPIHQQYVDLAKSYNLPVMIHSCGFSRWAFEDFIEMGIDAVDTLQPEITHMDPQSLVDSFGGRLSFHGSISTTGVLSYGTPEEVTQEVKKTLEIMKPTHSYMLSPTHLIQDNTPLENVLAMYEAARTYGSYE